MEEDIIKLYQEAIALLRLRNNGIELFGDYELNDKKGVRFALKWLDTNRGLLCSEKFKFCKNHTEALRYFIKCSQNIYKLR